ncbi:MAG: hypothetical protein MI919_08100 [Holophagales bacterium]|nr:hypothetical protein [Holophagales bacterium]
MAALEGWHRGRGGRATLVTQNVDCLHESAGSPDVIKVHGSVDRLRCASDRGCRHGAPSGSLARESVDFGSFLADPSLGTLPRCPSCGELLRQHVLWFDEYYTDHDDYQWPRVQEAASTGDLFLFVGTSFAVGVTELFLQTALWTSTPVYSVDPSGQRPYAGVTALPHRAEELLAAVCRRLELELE